MSLWVKICGNTSLDDAQVAAKAGADALGFVFAPSPRRVTKGQAAGIIAGLPAPVEKIGVFTDADLVTIADHVEQCGLTGVQLHSLNLPGVTAGLRKRFGESLRVLQVIHFGEHAAGQLRSAQDDSSVDAVLVDSRTATAVGGTGVAFDWNAARATIFRPAGALRLVAAGGLHPGNVAEAIAVLGPWGVDVVTGVEASPGRKDPEKVQAFIAAARTASKTAL